MIQSNIIFKTSFFFSICFFLFFSLIITSLSPMDDKSRPFIEFFQLRKMFFFFIFSICGNFVFFSITIWLYFFFFLSLILFLCYIDFDEALFRVHTKNNNNYIYLLIISTMSTRHLKHIRGRALFIRVQHCFLNFIFFFFFSSFFLIFIY